MSRATPDEIKEAVLKELDSRSMDIGLDQWVELLEELVSDLESRLEAARCDQNRSGAV